MDDIAEIVQTIESLQSELDDLLVRGLRATEPATLARLRAREEEFERIGAGHMAQRLAKLSTAIDNDDPAAAKALLEAQTSLRLFERVLTVEVAGTTLQSLIENAEGEMS